MTSSRPQTSRKGLAYLFRVFLRIDTFGWYMIYIYMSLLFPKILAYMPRIWNHQLVFPKPWDMSWFETPDVRPAFLIRRPAAAALMQSRPIEAFLVEETSTKHRVSPTKLVPLVIQCGLETRWLVRWFSTWNIHRLFSNWNVQLKWIVYWSVDAQTWKTRARSASSDNLQTTGTAPIIVGKCIPRWPFLA